MATCEYTPSLDEIKGWYAGAVDEYRCDTGMSVEDGEVAFDRAIAAHDREMATLKSGLYRNALGAELHVTPCVGPVSGKGVRPLGGIWLAEDRDPIFGTTCYLVTPASMRDCGYERIPDTFEEYE